MVHSGISGTYIKQYTRSRAFINWVYRCAQIALFSTGGSARPSGVSIPGYVSANHPGVLYDYWNNMNPRSYSIPGPEPYKVTNSGGGTRVPAEFPKKYPICLVSNADWCARPVPDIKDEASCWSVHYPL